MMTTVEHPSIGTYWRYAPVLQLSDTPSRAPTFCELGEHTRALLTELGYDGDEIERLHDDGVVGWQAETAAATRVAQRRRYSEMPRRVQISITSSTIDIGTVNGSVADTSSMCASMSSAVGSEPRGASQPSPSPANTRAKRPPPAE